MQWYFNENELAASARFGSCGLHVTHGAFKTGFKKTNWNIIDILKAMHRLVQDSPARRDMYLNETGLTKYINYLFCGIIYFILYALLRLDSSRWIPFSKGFFEF